MYCWNCGARIRDNSVFCSSCGVSISLPEQPEHASEPLTDVRKSGQPQKKRIVKKVVIIISLCASIMVSIMFTRLS